MYPTSVREQKKECFYGSILSFIEQNITLLNEIFDIPSDIEEDNQYDWIVDNLGEKEAYKQANKWLKNYTKKSNKDAIYVAFKKQYIAVDVNCDIIKGIENGFLSKSEAEELIKISKTKTYGLFGSELQEIYDLLEEKFPCQWDYENDSCTNCRNCD